MSYADVAASGPSQTAEEARAPAQPQPVRETSPSPRSTVDVDQPHVGSVPSSFPQQTVQTDTQAERLENEEYDTMTVSSDNTNPTPAQSKTEKAKGKAKQVEKELEEEALYIKEEARRGAELADKNKDNPVFVGNIVVVGAITAVLGTRFFKWYNSGGQATWGMIAGWTGAIAALGLGDYFATRWFLQKYPPKK